VDGPRFAVEAVPETLARSNLGALAPGDGIDLERPLAASGRFDGHIVQGHVDGVGVIREVTPEGGAVRMWVDVPAALRRYLVEKGSVAMDGVSLTVSGADEQGFEVVLIPHTLEVTVLGSRGPGSRVNLEMDVLAKYVERLMEERG
jgi:riboflavin synthase